MSLLYTASFKEFGSLVCLWHDVKLRKTQLEVRSLNVTWRRDLWSHRSSFFGNVGIVGWIAMANLAALRAAVFFAICEKPEGGGADNRPPAVRGLTRAPLGGGLFRAPPPLVFLWYLLNRYRYHRQTCSTLSPNIFTHCVKILKFRVS